jgi:uncharacterized membrane protein
MVSPGQRLLICAGLGLVVGVIVAFVTPWQIAILAGWNAALGAFIAWLWIGVSGMDAAATKAAAIRNDFSHLTGDVLLLAASVLNLAVVGLAVIESIGRPPAVAGLINGAAVLSVGLSWAVVHTVFAFRYADLYYDDDPGGVDFGGARPSYADFAYLAFTIGMTYQVSDTALRTTAMRKVALRHALLSYLFGSVILAAVINVVAGLFRG